MKKIILMSHLSFAITNIVKSSSSTVSARICKKRVLKLLLSLKNYFLSFNPCMKKGDELKTRNCKLIYSLLEELLRFLASASAWLIQLNLSVQRADPLTHFLCDCIFSFTRLLEVDLCHQVWFDNASEVRFVINSKTSHERWQHRRQ